MIQLQRCIKWSLLTGIVPCVFALAFSQVVFPARGQISPQKQSAQSHEPNLPAAAREAEIRQQAFDLVNGEIERAKSYSRIRDRIRVWASAADVLWESDPEKARQLLRDSYSLIERAKPVAHDNETEAAVNARTGKLRETLRSEVLAIAQKHDRSLLKDLMQSVKEDARKAAELHGRPDVFGSSSLQKRALASLAVTLAATDPEKALDYATESLGYGVPQEFGELFRVLVVTSRPLAHELFARAINVFASDDSTNLYDALILSTYLTVLPEREPDGQLIQKFLLSALVRMNRVWNTLQSSESKDPMAMGALSFASGRLYGLYRLYLPERLSDVERLIKEVAQASGSDQKVEPPSQDSNQETAEGKVKMAERELGENRDALYLEAALMLAKEGNYNRAVDIASRADNHERSSAVITYIRRQQAEDLIKREDLYSAIKVIELIDDPELRAEGTVLFAKAGQKADSQLTRSVLDKTRKLFEDNASSAAHARAYLWLASSYSTFEPFLSFDLMTSAVKVANKAKDLDDLTSESRLIYLGGRSIRAVTVGTAKGDFRPGFKVLASSDFSQAALIAETFENQLYRGLAVIAVAEPVLASKAKRN